MVTNDPDTNQPGKRAVFVIALIVLGFLVYLMVKDMQKLPSDISTQTTSPFQGTSQTAATPINNTREITLGFRVSGSIDQMFFAEHAEVKQGDILATLDKVPFEEALTSAKAQLQAAQAQYNKSIHTPISNFNAIEAARANVETAQTAYNEAHAELEKYQGRMTAGVFAGESERVHLDDVQNDHDAQLALEKARRELVQQEDIGGNNTDHEGDKAAVQVAEANVAVAQTNLADTQLVAPSNGIVDKRVGEAGVIVPAGTAVYVLSVPAAASPNPQ